MVTPARPSLAVLTVPHGSRQSRTVHPTVNLISVGRFRRKDSHWRSAAGIRNELTCETHHKGLTIVLICISESGNATEGVIWKARDLWSAPVLLK